MRKLSWAVLTAAAVVAGATFFCGGTPGSVGSPPRATDGVVLGRAYAPVLAATYADGWIAAASAIEQGKSVAEAQTVLQQTWQEGRIRAFRLRVQPSFSLVLPEGNEPADPASRAKVASLWRSFASGLKAGR